MPSLAITSQQQAEIDVFAGLIQSGIDAWTEAGHRLVAMIDRDPDIQKKIRAAHPGISSEQLLVFERIGRRQIYAPLLADNSVGGRTLIEMPYEIQKKYAHAAIEVVTSTKGTTARRTISELSRAEVKQVFVDGEMLSPKQQLAELQARAEAVVQVMTPRPVKKVTEIIQCVRLTLDKKGGITSTPTSNTYKCQQVRCDRQPDGSLCADVIFYRNI